MRGCEVVGDDTDTGHDTEERPEGDAIDTEEEPGRDTADTEGPGVNDHTR